MTKPRSTSGPSSQQQAEKLRAENGYAMLQPWPQLRALHKKIQGKFPQWQPPKLFVINDIKAFRLQVGEQFDDDGAYWLDNTSTQERGVYIGKKMLELFSKRELTVFTTHEYGHGWADDLGTLGRAWEELSSGQYHLLQKTIECRADHFAAYFIPDAPQHMASAFKKLRHAQGASAPDESDTHPADAVRMHGKHFREAMKIKPGKVKFDSHCNADLSGVQSPGATLIYGRGAKPDEHERRRVH